MKRLPLAVALAVCGAFLLTGCLDEDETKAVTDAETYFSTFIDDLEGAEEQVPVALVQMRDGLTTVRTNSEKDWELVRWLLGLLGLNGIATVEMLRRWLKHRRVLSDVVRTIGATRTDEQGSQEMVIDKARLKAAMPMATLRVVEKYRKVHDPREKVSKTS